MQNLNFLSKIESSRYQLRTKGHLAKCLRVVLSILYGKSIKVDNKMKRKLCWELKTQDTMGQDLFWLDFYRNALISLTNT